MTQKNRALFREWLIWVDGIQSVQDTENFIKATVRNERSQKLGFSHEGRQREGIKVNGSVMDVDMFALLRREYISTK